MTPTNHAAAAGQLSPCPWWPKCVCSRNDAWRLTRVEPFVVSGDPSLCFGRLKALVARMPRTVVVTATDEYLHAVCRTRWFGYPDDIEFRLLPEEGVIHVRAASRLAPFWDFGVNRRRIERLRRQFQQSSPFDDPYGAGSSDAREG